MPAFLSAGSAAMHGALVPIAYQTPSGVTSITFDNIPQVYQDLMVVGYARSAATATNENHFFRLNGNTSTLYSRTVLEGDGSSASSVRESNLQQTYIGAIPAASATANLFSSYILHFLNYANTSTNKSGLVRFANDRNGSGITNIVANLYRSTSAITSLTLFNGTGNFASGTSFSLYGVRKIGQ
jgi:hypothetical protein